MLPPYPESSSSIACNLAALCDVEPVPTCMYIRSLRVAEEAFLLELGPPWPPEYGLLELIVLSMERQVIA